MSDIWYIYTFKRFMCFDMSRYFTAIAIFVLIYPILMHSSDDLRANPEKYIGKDRTTQIATGKNYMVVTSDPMATQAAYDVLSNNGTAADAAIAAQLVLGLTEPQSSGLGGGAFALYYDAAKKSLITIDGRETAPISVRGDYFIKDSGEPMSFYEAVLDGRSIGIPGTPALLGTLHKKYGTISLKELIIPAYNLAQYGFLPSKGLSKALNSDIGKLDINPTSRKYFYQNNILINHEYASVLKDFAKFGYEIFYSKPISTNIIKAANRKNGMLQQKDFNNYQVILREPICDYFLQHKICSMGEPSSGALTMLQILKLIETNPSWHNYIEASKLAFSDRNYYMADPDYIESPGIRLLDDKYISERRAILKDNKILDNPDHGQPSNWKNNSLYINQEYEEKGTTHISIIDRFGNAISMTSTIENSFGSRIMANGYLLNNELTDFSFLPWKDNKKIANRIEGGKRPRSSMTPTIVFSKLDELPFLIIGSAGGSRIIGHVTQRIIDILYNKKTLQESIERPHVLNRGQITEAESSNKITEDLITKGHKINITNIASGLNGIYVDPDTRIITGVSDPRRIGTSMGN